MEKIKEMSIDDFCEKIDTIDPDAIVVCGIGNKSCNMFTKCRKRNVEFWAMYEGGVRFFIDGIDIDTNGIILDAVKCVVVEDNHGIHYDICNKSNEIIFLVSILSY